MKFKIESLTPRQKEIIERFVAGKSNDEIGRELFIDSGSVRKHLERMYPTFGVKSRKELEEQLGVKK